MEIRPIDVFDDAELTAWWETSKAVDAEGRDYPTFWSLRAATIALREDSRASFQLPLAAFGDDGAIIGTSHVRMPLLDNTHLASLDPKVLPAQRGRGVGRALLEQSLAVVAEKGRSTALCEVNLPLDDDPLQPDLRFARSHGFEVAIVDLHRVLDLPVGVDRLDELAAEAAPQHEGYRLVSWMGRVPDEQLAGFCAVQSAFNEEAPSGELELEPEVWDEARVREGEERAARQGRHTSVTAALDEAGTMVGLTEMVSTDDDRTLALQSGTLVAKEARGHRLGLAMKVANLLQLQRRCPDVTTVHSWNAEENGPMVAINDTLGFRPVERLAELQRKLH